MSVAVRIEFNDRNAGKTPIRPPPPCRTGQEKRVIHREHSDTLEMACERAKLLAWWPRRVNRRIPYFDARNWIWIVRAV